MILISPAISIILPRALITSITSQALSNSCSRNSCARNLAAGLPPYQRKPAVRLSPHGSSYRASTWWSWGLYCGDPIASYHQASGAAFFKDVVEKSID
jgi:hypothetical protein